ncbi:hypothetical protein HDV62DRAFT_267245 [Trichoderma sp. SZMC 28011]
MYQVLDNTFSNILEAPRQRQQRRVRAETQRRQEKDRVTAGPEFPAQHAVRRLGDEELAMALVAAVHGDKEDGGAKRGEESTDGIKLFGEDLEDDEREGEEAQGGAHVSAFKGTLGGADFNESVETEEMSALLLMDRWKNYGLEIHASDISVVAVVCL